MDLLFFFTAIFTTIFNFFCTAIIFCIIDSIVNFFFPIKKFDKYEHQININQLKNLVNPPKAYFATDGTPVPGSIAGDICDLSFDEYIKKASNMVKNHNKDIFDADIESIKKLLIYFEENKENNNKRSIIF